MKYDIIVLGASGYTGQYVVEYVAKNLRDRPHLTWAVAGRTESKLLHVLKQVEQSFPDVEASKIPILLCDTSDTNSLETMSGQGRLVLNCVGPYRFHGENVVRACLATGTHHVDISGEPEYLERMQLNFGEEASERGIYVIGSCGFDSIPADLGQIFLTDAMEGDVNEIETYLSIDVPSHISGPTLNFGTWQSAVYGFGFADALKPIRKKLFAEKLPPQKPKLIPRGSLHKSEIMNGWCLPFPGSDRAVMIRTQRFLYNAERKRPTQIQSYITYSSLFTALKVIFVGLIFGLLAVREYGRYLLETYPGFFSFGAVSRKGPSKEMADNTNFTLTLVGKGWKDKVQDRTDMPNRKVRVSVFGKNIGYGSTCEMMVQAALSILEESDLMPGNGGVLTPGYAFAKTTIIKRLNDNGVIFTVEKIEDL